MPAARLHPLDRKGGTLQSRRHRCVQEGSPVGHQGSSPRLSVDRNSQLSLEQGPDDLRGATRGNRMLQAESPRANFVFLYRCSTI